MIFRSIKRAFSTSIYNELASTKNIKKFALGQIPQALQYSRPFSVTKLDNGITVASEIMPTNISTISVFIKCGSRQQTGQTSGTAHFLEHLHFKGTSNRRRQQLQLQVQNMGGNLNAYTSRENTCYTIQVFKNDLSKGVQIVGDMITNSLYRKSDVENERSTIYRQLIETQKSNPLQTTIQIAHYGIYKNHQMGLPILGSIENMQNISRQMIVDYHNKNYVGNNIIVIASGQIDHNLLIQSINKYIKVQKGQDNIQKLVKPKFSPGISSLQSSLTNLLNFVQVIQAPSFFQNDFFPFLLLQRVLADRPETFLELQIMKNSNSYRYQKHLANYQFINKQKGFYSSYWDTGIFGNYFLCDPKKVFEIIKLNLQGYSIYSNKVTDQELERAKRRVYVQILQHQTQNDLTQSIGNNLLYYERKVSAKQVAERVACVSAQQIQNVAQRLLNNDSMHILMWGNTKMVPFKNQ